MISCYIVTSKIKLFNQDIKPDQPRKRINYQTNIEPLERSEN